MPAEVAVAQDQLVQRYTVLNEVNPRAGEIHQRRQTLELNISVSNRLISLVDAASFSFVLHQPLGAAT